MLLTSIQIFRVTFTHSWSVTPAMIVAILITYSGFLGSGHAFFAGFISTGAEFCVLVFDCLKSYDCKKSISTSHQIDLPFAASLSSC